MSQVRSTHSPLVAGQSVGAVHVVVHMPELVDEVVDDVVDEVVSDVDDVVSLVVDEVVEPPAPPPPPVPILPRSTDAISSQPIVPAAIAPPTSTMAVRKL
jgi:hypothetical protein